MAGDLLGNLWRFDISGELPAARSAVLMAQLTDAQGAAQPITIKPVLAEINDGGARIKVVVVGTGRYLGLPDLADTQTQSVYVLKDNRAPTGMGNARRALDATGQPALVQQRAALVQAPQQEPSVSLQSQPVRWSTGMGWFFDLPVAGERVNVAPQLVLGTLYVGSNLPRADACTAGGSSRLYRLDLKAGAAPTGAVAAGVSLGQVLVMGLSSLLTHSGSKVTTIVTKSDRSLDEQQDPRPLYRGALRRAAWRVLP